jgi:glycosyltransferase involved in cell wall biosynthesis
VIVCTLNEEHSIYQTLEGIPDSISEVIVVDGHSKDRTLEMVKKARPGARVILQRGRGKPMAMHQGIEAATGEIVVTLDGDGSSDPAEIGEFVRAILEGNDVAKGSRFLRGAPTMPFHRQYLNIILTLFADFLYGTRFTDVTCGFNAFRRDAILSLDFLATGFGYEPVIYALAKKRRYRIVEVPCRDAGRKGGASKLPALTQGLRAVSVLLRERFRWETASS